MFTPHVLSSYSSLCHGIFPIPNYNTFSPITYQPHPTSCSYASLSSPAAKSNSSKLQPQPLPNISPTVPTKVNENDDDDTKKRKNKEKKSSISKIQVPRQKHIPVSKTHLLHALLAFLRNDNDSSGDDEDTDSVVSQFGLLASCLDSILHAEHKSILEEMRADYLSSQSVKNEEDLPITGPVTVREQLVDFMEGVKFVDDLGNGSVGTSENGSLQFQENQISFLNGFDLQQLFGSVASNQIDPTDSSNAEVATATRFQRSFMKLLQEAQFEELSVRDLMLTSTLNTDYLLTLPIYVDWKRASESKAIIFRRGYSTERQKGLLIVEKLDYLQSKVLQGIFGLISKPLLQIGLWTKEVIQSICEEEDKPVWFNNFQLWVQETSLFQQPQAALTHTSEDLTKANQDLDRDLPIWLAAEKAVSRYEGFLSSIGPRSRLIRKFLIWVGVIPSTPEVPFEFDGETNAASEAHLRPISLSRISLNDIWRPASSTYCGNDLWRMLKVGFSIIFSRSVLQEPAFQELILLYTEETGDAKETGKAEIPSLQLKIYEKIPLPDLPVIFPHKKLSFRIIDTVRLDVASILGLLAYAINYRFVNLSSSPSAVLLDVIAVTALIFFLIRVALGYKQTRDRYELLVNRALYEKTLASGFGSVHFLIDASEQQQYKECILAYAILLKAEIDQFPCRESLGEECEKFLYRTFKEKVQMPIDKAVDKLIEFGLVIDNDVNGKNVLQVVPCSIANEALRRRWECLLS